jgi:D-3-phosphoglycerate dehydrogenase / 2-oxoglutarate reductase
LRGTKILIGPSSFASLDYAPMEKLLGAGCEVIDNPYKRKLTEEELLELLSGDINGLIAGLEPLNKRVLTNSKLKIISRCGSGMSNVDQDAARELGIKVYYTPYGPTSAVAELTLGVLLSLLRFISQMNIDLHQGKWNKKIGVQLEGKTVVVVGFGRIGQRFAELLEPFNVNIIIVDPHVGKDFLKFTSLSIKEALPKADIVSLHCSYEEEIIGEEELSIMKQGVLLLNASRGGVVNETDLRKYLDSGKVAGAWLDAFEHEPYYGPLKEYPQVILTPHVGSYTMECRKRMETEAVENLLTGFQEGENEI